MFKEGTIAIWDKYYDQANPLVILQGDDWVELTLTDLITLILKEAKAENDPRQH